MGTYNVPRDTKGEGRILYIFSTRALMFTFIGAAIGLLPYFILDALGLSFAGFIVVGVLGLIGFGLATFKVPKTNLFKFTRVAGGEKIDEAIIRYVKFKRNKSKIYVYKEESNNQEEKTKTSQAKEKIIGGILKNE